MLHSTIIPRSGHNFLFFLFFSILERAEGEEKEAYHYVQQAGVDESSVAAWQVAVFIGLQASGVGHDMGNIALLLNPMEKV